MCPVYWWLSLLSLSFDTIRHDYLLGFDTTTDSTEALPHVQSTLGFGFGVFPYTKTGNCFGSSFSEVLRALVTAVLTSSVDKPQSMAKARLRKLEPLRGITSLPRHANAGGLCGCAQLPSLEATLAV
ncbi:hypothetical protein HPB52_008177 [Rhipicephalus sanguineus]|uniref:Secreted protein n=1 Tax=Rhipicephalus sanguineus TaxID=34632 RepID=A0A9D4SVY1_RHISA|nr:hypothetical protein HPB52_008177 [Rhipicephalus sanguineus]